MTRHSSLRPFVHAIICVLALPAIACIGSETEIVTAADAVRLMGSSFVHDDSMAQDQTMYTWDEARRGYVDTDRIGLVRFGRLRGEAYLAQFQALPNALKPVPTGGQKPPAGRGISLLFIIRVSPPRVHVQMPTCLGLRDETPRLARSLGVELDESSRLIASLKGSRAGIIGFFLAGLSCEPGTMDIRLLPQALSPGGIELAGAAAKPGAAGNPMVASLQKQCLGGGAEACHKLGQMYARGDGVTADPAQAANLFERLCTGGRMEGCLDLALLYDAGTGVALDSARATSLIKQACSGGEPYACELLKTRR